MNRTLELLKKGRELLGKGDKYLTRFAMARNDEDVPIPPYDPTAVCFCSVGVLIHFANEEELAVIKAVKGMDLLAFSSKQDFPLRGAIDALTGAIPPYAYYKEPTSYSDKGVSYTALLGWWDRAIANEEARLTNSNDIRKFWLSHW